MSQKRRICVHQVHNTLFYFTISFLFQKDKLRKISIPTPRKAIGNSEEVGVPTANFFKCEYEAQLEFSEGWGVQIKKPSMKGWGEWIFSGTTE